MCEYACREFMMLHFFNLQFYCTDIKVSENGIEPKHGKTFDPNVHFPNRSRCPNKPFPPISKS